MKKLLYISVNSKPEDLSASKTVARKFNDAINEMDYNLNEFHELVYSYNFDDDKIQSWEYHENPNRIGENISVTLSFNGKYKHFKNAYTFESYIYKYFNLSNDNSVIS